MNKLTIAFHLIGLAALMIVGCAQATVEPLPTEPPTEALDITETTSVTLTPTIEVTVIAPTATLVPTPTIDPQFITPTLISELPYWSPPNTAAPGYADSLGAPLPYGAVTRIGLGNPTMIALSPDAQFLAVATEAQVVMLRSDTLELLWAIHIPKEVRGITWSPDGIQIVAWMREDQRVVFLNPTSGSLIRVLTFPEFPADAAWSPDGTELALVYGADLTESRATPSAVVILNQGGQTLRTFEVQNEAPLDIEWSPNGQLLAIGAYQDTFVLNANTGDQVLHQKVSSEVLRFNSQGTMLAGAPGWFAARGDFVSLWDLQSGQYYELPGEPYLTVIYVAWSPDGTQLISGSSNNWPVAGELLLWDVATHSLLHDFSDKKMSVFTASWSPDGSRLAVGGMYTPDGMVADGRLIVWEPDTRQALVALNLPSEDIRDIVWLPDNLSFISVGVYSEHIIRWDAQNGEALHNVQNSTWLNSLMWAEDGRTLVTNPNPPQFDYAPLSVTSPNETLNASETTTDALLSTVTVSDAQSGTELFSFSDIGFVHAMAWSPDEALLAVAASYPRVDFGGKVYIWDIESESMLFALDFEATFILDLAWSSDGTIIAGGEGYAQGGFARFYENPVLVWDVATQQLLHRFVGHTGDVRDVMWSPDGSLLASSSADGTVLIWDIP
jgi:WD40 repeat protein